MEARLAVTIRIVLILIMVTPLIVMTDPLPQYIVPVCGRQGAVDPDADRDRVRPVGHFAAPGLVISGCRSRGPWRCSASMC